MKNLALIHPTNMEANSLVPSLRFSEFQTDWNVKKLKELVKINQGLQIPISDRYSEKIEGSYFYITNAFLKSNSENKYFILNPNKSVLCDVNDILMTRTGNTGMVVTNVKGAFHNNFYNAFLFWNLIDFLRIYVFSAGIPDDSLGQQWMLPHMDPHCFLEGLLRPPS